MSHELYSRLYCMRPVQGLLAVNLTLLAQFMRDETELTIRLALDEMGFHTHGKHTVDLQISHIRRVITGARYVLHAEPFRLQQIDSISAFDCSSLTQWAAGLLGFNLPRRSVEQFLAPVGELLCEPAVLKPYDIVFTTSSGTKGWNIDGFHRSRRPDHVSIGHCGLALNNDTILHAADSKTGIIESTFEEFLLEDGGLVKPLRGVRRLYPEGCAIITMIVPPHIGLESVADLPVLIRLHNFRKNRDPLF